MKNIAVPHFCHLDKHFRTNSSTGIHKVKKRWFAKQRDWTFHPIEFAHSDGQSTAWNCSARHKMKFQQAGQEHMFTQDYLWKCFVGGRYVWLIWSLVVCGKLVGVLITHINWLAYDLVSTKTDHAILGTITEPTIHRVNTGVVKNTNRHLDGHKLHSMGGNCTAVEIWGGGNSLVTHENLWKCFTNVR